MPTLWESLEEPDILDTTEFEYLFSKDTAQEKRKPLSETYEKKTKAKKVFLVSLYLLFLCHCLVLHFKKTPFLFIVKQTDIRWICKFFIRISGLLIQILLENAWLLFVL